MSDSTHINELRKEIEALCDNCDRPNKEEIGNIILSAMVFGFGEGLKAPSADRPQKVIAQITFDEEKLHEIVKEAVERFKEEYEITDRPQGEWIEMYRNGFGNMICMCSKCNFHATKSNYCPNCGAKMKRADDE